MSETVAKKNIRLFSLQEPLAITLFTFLTVVLIARLIAFFVIKTDELPRSLFISIDGFRLHHFVYGNFIILIMGFLQIVLGKNIPRRLGAFIYGIGLGLVIDEFALWSGAIRYLSADPLQVFNTINFSAVVVVTMIMLWVLYAKQKHKREEAEQNQPPDF